MQSGSSRRRARHEVPTHHWARAACAGGGDGAGSADTDGRSSSRGMWGMWGGRAEAGPPHPARTQREVGRAVEIRRGGRTRRPRRKEGERGRARGLGESHVVSCTPTHARGVEFQWFHRVQRTRREVRCVVCVCVQRRRSAVTRLVTVSRYRLWRRPATAGPRFSNY